MGHGSLQVLGLDLVRQIFLHLKPRHLFRVMTTSNDMLRAASLFVAYWDRVAVHLIYRHYISPLPEPTWYSMTFTPDGYHQSMESFCDLVSDFIEAHEADNAMWNGSLADAVALYLWKTKRFQDCPERKMWERAVGKENENTITVKMALTSYLRWSMGQWELYKEMRSRIWKIEDDTRVPDKIKGELVRDLSILYDYDYEGIQRSMGRLDYSAPRNGQSNRGRSMAAAELRKFYKGSV